MAQDPKTIEGRKGAGADTQPGTIQFPSEAAPALPTLQAGAGAAVPIGAPPAMPQVRYEVGLEIARGGMGRVVEATDTLLGRVVAVKEALATDADALRRFARETRITARLEHPSIVPVHDAGHGPNGLPYYVMRKVSGRPLEKLVAAADTLAKRLALVPHVVAAAQAVAHAHTRGIVHRDIKPANILVGDLGETILIDWGLAKVIGEQEDEPPAAIQPAEEDDQLKTRAGIVYGTPGFISPEQLRGAQDIDERIDVYALGATLYHLLSRKPPHHAKTADDMMRAAIAGPPPPLAELVPGVPRELSTIVDKALAHDPSVRYPNATALAEELQRFLTGQLVASHHYTAVERIVRFIRKNRVPVSIAAFATVTLAVVGVFAVHRVVDERDRADDQARLATERKRIAEDEREKAERRADDLLLTQARSQVQSNPTGAVVSIKPLAAKRWREVRAIAAAARAAGVAFQLPASPTTRMVELSRDGLHALAAGDDGAVRLYDLPRRSSHDVARVTGPAIARFADDDRRIVIASEARLVIIDPSNGVRRPVEAASPIVDLAVVGSVVYWTDDAGKLWELDLAGSAPVEIAAGESVHALAPSPDGRWLALAGESNLRLLDRTQAVAPAIVTDGDTRDMRWNPDGTHLAAVIDQVVIDVDATAFPPTVIHRYTVGQRTGVAYGAGTLPVVGPTGVALPQRIDVPRKQIASPLRQLREARGNTIVAAGQTTLVVLSDDGDLAIPVPAPRLLGIEASPRSPYVIALAEDRLLVWNLDDIQPRRVTTRSPAGAGFVGTARALASFGVDAPARWIDLASGNAQPIDQVPAIRDVVAAPSGRVALAIDMARHARVVTPGRPVHDLGAIEQVALVDDDHAVVTTAAGSVELRDLEGDGRRVLVERKAKPVGLVARGGLVAVGFADGTVWRHEPSGADAAITVTPAPSGPLVALAGGELAIATGTKLQLWRGDRAAELTRFAKPIERLAGVDARVLLAITSDGTGYLVDLAAPDHADAQTIGTGASISDVALIAVPAAQGKVDLVDPLVQQKFTLATPGTAPFSYPQISPDGRYVLALSQHGLMLWKLALPSRDDLPRWLDDMTNLSPDSSPTPGVIQRDR